MVTIEDEDVDVTFFVATSAAWHTSLETKKKKNQNYECKMKIVKLHKDMEITGKLGRNQWVLSLQNFTGGTVVGQINKVTQYYFYGKKKKWGWLKY